MSWPLDKDQALLDLLQTFQLEGRTIIVITHDMTLVAEYVHEGRLLYHGPTVPLFAQPALIQ